MNIDLNTMNEDDVRRSLELIVRQANSNITQWAVEREVLVAALVGLDGEEFEHHKSNIKNHENDIIFARKRAEVAKAMLEELG